MLDLVSPVNIGDRADHDSDQAGGRVLIVEDDADIADVLRRSLRNEGYEVRTSADGVDALDVAAGSSPTSSSSTSACRASTGSRSAGGCGRRATCRS